MIRNAKIRSTMLGPEDHGILSCMLDMDYGSGGQGFGGWALDEPRRDDADKFLGRFGTAFGMEFVRRLLAVLEVDRWEKLPGTFVRVETDSDSEWTERIVRVGHPLKDQWFDPKALADEFNSTPTEGRT